MYGYWRFFKHIVNIIIAFIIVQHNRNNVIKGTFERLSNMADVKILVILSEHSNGQS